MKRVNMEANRLALAQRIRESREYLGLSQDEVSDVLGIARPAVTNMEQGTRKVESAELDRLAKLFGCSADYLLGNEPDKKAHEAFLARTFSGLSQKDLAEVAKFAEFLRTSSGEARSKAKAKK